MIEYFSLFCLIPFSLSGRKEMNRAAFSDSEHAKKEISSRIKQCGNIYLFPLRGIHSYKHIFRFAFKKLL